MLFKNLITLQCISTTILLIQGKPQSSFDNDVLREILDLDNDSVGKDQFLDSVSTSDNKQVDEAFFNTLLQKGLIPNQSSKPTVSNSDCNCVPQKECGKMKEGGNTGVFNVPGVGELVDLRNQGQFCPDPFQVCCDQVQGKTVSNTLPLQQSSNCGQRNSLGLGVRFQNFDTQAQYSEFPWTVALLDDRQDRYICGGSLIHPRVVLGVGHCAEKYVSNPRSIRARMGEWNFNSSFETFAHKDILVERIILHPLYTRRDLKSNVALLILSENVPDQPNINTICLPSSTDQWDSTNCHSSGWGKDVFGNTGRYQQIMKKALLPIFNKNECVNILRQQRQNLQNLILDESSICAGGNGQDTCTGDGGSPLICKKTTSANRYVQIGIVAWGIECNRPGVPGVYTSVPNVVDWIKDEVVKQFGRDAPLSFTDS